LGIQRKAWRSRRIHLSLTNVEPSALITLDPRPSTRERNARARPRMTTGVMITRARLQQMRQPKQPAIYILASKRNGTLYIGVTSDLAGRISIHKQNLVSGFTNRYGVHVLVYYEHFDTMPEAIAREKQLKKFARAKKIALIEVRNREWSDLYEEIQN
jgi:putative endonuclease